MARKILLIGLVTTFISCLSIGLVIITKNINGLPKTITYNNQKYTLLPEDVYTCKRYAFINKPFDKENNVYIVNENLLYYEDNKNGIYYKDNLEKLDIHNSSLNFDITLSYVPSESIVNSFWFYWYEDVNKKTYFLDNTSLEQLLECLSDDAFKVNKIDVNDYILCGAIDISFTEIDIYCQQYLIYCDQDNDIYYFVDQLNNDVYIKLSYNQLAVICEYDD